MLADKFIASLDSESTTGSRMRCGAVLLAIGGLAISLSVSDRAASQTSNGSVCGRVVDAQDRAVPGALMILRSKERVFERHTNTNTQGEYIFDLVPPGKFTVTVEHSGFASSSMIVEVVVATPLRVDLVLRIETMQEEVKVIGENGVSVQTENANLGRVISTNQLAALPSLTRSPYDFIALVPGAVLSNDGIGVGFAVNGGRTQSANYLLDGTESNDIFMSAPAMNIPLDAVQEFNVQTNHYGAEYGRNSGFTTNIATKSGTTEFHGSLYDYLRNSALAANSFDNNANDLPRAEFNRNQFGGSLGGPVLRSHLFFFAAIEGIAVRSTGPNTFYVPTPDLLAISAPGTQALFSRYPLPADLSTTNVQLLPVCPYGTNCDPQTGAGIVTIPAFAFTSKTGPQDFGAGPPQNSILATGRLDWSIGTKTQAFARYAIEDKSIFAEVSQPYSAELDQPIYGHNQNAAVSVIHSWSPTSLTETRAAYEQVTGDPERLGGESPVVPNPPLPFFSFINNSASLPTGGSSSGGPTHVYQLFQSATLVRGNHTLKFGGQYVQIRQNLTFGFAGQIADAEFQDLQGFVDGTLAFYAIALDPKGKYPGQYVDPPFGPPTFTRHYRYNEPALFIADTWKITPRLTITPGLRWEYFGVFHSVGAEHNLDSNFYPGTGTDSLERIANGQMLRTIDAPGDLRGRFYLPDYKNFAPRLGIAYDLFGDGKTVIRTGAGIFYDRRVGWELFRAYQNPPSFSYTQLSDIPMTAELVTNQYAVFPAVPIQLTESLTQDPDTNTKSAYAASWNATIEQDFGGAFVAGASYLGSSGSRLYSTNNVNRVGSNGLIDPTCIVPRIASDGITIIGSDYSQCPRLNPNLKNVILRGNGGHSSYEALQLRLDSRLIPRLGLQFGANYTWSHSIDNRSVSGTSGAVAEVGNGYLDAFQPGLDRGPSDFDVRHRAAANFVWQIPLSKNPQGWRDRYLFGGWELSGILSCQTGQPFTVADFGVPDLTVERARPRLTGPAPQVGPLVPDAVSPNHFLYLPINSVYDPVTGLCIANAAPFACEISVNGPFEGTLPRNTFRQPGLFFLNTAVLKSFPLPRGDAQLQFRAEFYNLFNHSNLYVNGNSTDVSNPTFSNTANQTAPGVTASFHDNRQIVLALKLIF